MSEGAFAGAIPAQPPKATANSIILYDVGEIINIKIPNQIHSKKQFLNWFRDWLNHPSEASKVVDKDGMPLVVYHGTAASFDKLRSARDELTQFIIER